MSNGEDVAIYLATLKGRQSAQTAWIGRELAINWVNQHMQSGAEWDGSGEKTRCWCEESQTSGTVEKIEVKDALALIGHEPLAHF